MIGEASAYAALGLRPGAARAEVEEAYRRLIKLHHPDRNGGDGERAAEINRAYTTLRRNVARPVRAVPIAVRQPVRRPPRNRAGWLFVVAVLAGVAAGVVYMPVRGPSRTSLTLPIRWHSPQSSQPGLAGSPLVDLDAPVDQAVVDRAVGDALKFHAGGDSTVTAEYSRVCHNRLREDPNLAWFDTCAAFDEAVVTLDDSTSREETGPFSAPAVIARQMAAARLITDDSLAADLRLHQIRSRVEMTLIPKLDEAAAQPIL